MLPMRLSCLPLAIAFTGCPLLALAQAGYQPEPVPMPPAIAAPQDTPYGLREFAYIDPDGTAHRVGSRWT